MAKLAELVAAIEKHYPRALAEPWDSVGVISGDWQRPIERILLSVDIDDHAVLEAQSRNCQAIVSHHPLFLARHSVVSEPYKLRTVARANAAGIALFNAHTNADSARPGVSDALCELLGVYDTDALIPTSPDTSTGIGRIGRVQSELSLQEFVNHIAKVLGDSHVRAAGDLQQRIRIVAVCGGAGDSLLSTVRLTKADVFVTSDLRHHPVAEHFAAGGCAVIDIDHAIAEAVWLDQVQKVLEAELNVEVVRTQGQLSVWSA